MTYAGVRSDGRGIAGACIDDSEVLCLDCSIHCWDWNKSLGLRRCCGVWNDGTTFGAAGPEFPLELELESFSKLSIKLPTLEAIEASASFSGVAGVRCCSAGVFMKSWYCINRLTGRPDRTRCTQVLNSSRRTWRIEAHCNNSSQDNPKWLIRLLSMSSNCVNCDGRTCSDCPAAAARKERNHNSNSADDTVMNSLNFISSAAVNWWCSIISNSYLVGPMGNPGSITSWGRKSSISPDDSPSVAVKIRCAFALSARVGAARLEAVGWPKWKKSIRKQLKNIPEFDYLCPSA